MEALQQYLDLFAEHAPLIDAGSAEPLNSLRGHAYEMLRKSGLPARGSEDYENIDIPKMLSPDYGLNLQRIPLDVNSVGSMGCNAAVTSTTALRVENDLVHLPSPLQLPEGVEAMSLREAAEKYPELITARYGRLADMANPLVALNSMIVQDGLFIRVKRGVKADKPLQILNILASDREMMAVRRLLVVAEEGSEIKILVCDHTQNTDSRLLALECVELYVEAGARLDYYNIEESTRTTSRLSTVWAEQEADSRLNIDGITLFNGTTRNEYHCSFAGERAELRLYGMGIEDADRSVSTYTRISHDSPRCKSDELFKFSLQDDARGEFVGRIYVAPGAVGTEAYQANRNLVGSDRSKMASKPQLEIYNDDVKCSHGCAIGQLDEKQVFYMRTRGLSEEEAKLLLRQAFMADIIAAIDVASLRDRLHLLVERRFAGECSACRDALKQN